MMTGRPTSSIQLALVHGVGDGGSSGLEPDLGHGDLELLAVLCRLDGLGVCTDQLAPEPLEHAGLLQLHRQVETGLATEGRQHGIGSFFSMIFSRICRSSGST